MEGATEVIKEGGYGNLEQRRVEKEKGRLADSLGVDRPAAMHQQRGRVIVCKGVDGAEPKRTLGKEALGRLRVGKGLGFASKLKIDKQQ